MQGAVSRVDQAIEVGAAAARLQLDADLESARRCAEWQVRVMLMPQCRTPTAASRSGVHARVGLAGPRPSPPVGGPIRPIPRRRLPGRASGDVPRPRGLARGARTNRTPVRCTMRGHAVENHPDRRGHPQIDPWKSRSPMWTNGPRAWMSVKTRKPPHLAVAFAAQPLHLVVLALTTATHRRIVLEVTRPTETPNPAPANGTIRRPGARHAGASEQRRQRKRGSYRAGWTRRSIRWPEPRPAASPSTTRSSPSRRRPPSRARARPQPPARQPPAATPAPTARASTARIPTGSPPRA